MNHRLKGRKIIHGDILSPEILIAEFSEDFTPIEREKLVATLNHGHNMLLAYAHRRNQLDIRDVVDLLDNLELIYRQWEHDMMLARRKGDEE